MVPRPIRYKANVTGLSSMGILSNGSSHQQFIMPFGAKGIIKKEEKVAKKSLILCLVILIVGIGQSVNSEVKEIPSQDRIEPGSQPIIYGANKFEVLDPDFRPKGSEPKHYLPKGERHTGVYLQSGEVDLTLWGADRDFGPAYGVSMDVVPAGSYQGRIFVATMRLHWGNGDTIFTYYSDDNGSSWNNWWKIYTYSGWQFNDFSIACSRTKLAVFYQIYSSSKEYVKCFVFDFSSGYEQFYVDSSSSPTTEMHPDICSDAEDYSSVWFYLVYSKPNFGLDLAFKAFDESGGIHASAFLDGAASSKTYWDGDIDFDDGNLFVAYHILQDSQVRVRFSSDLGSSWTSKTNVGTGDDSKPRVAGHFDDAVVVREDADQGIAYNYTTNFGSSWSGSKIPCDYGDGCPAITEINTQGRYGIYYSNEKQEAHTCWMNGTSEPWQGYVAIGDVWASVRPYSHCYEIRYLWDSSNVGVVWIDDRTGSWHAWFDAGVPGGGIEEVFSQEPSLVRFQTYPNPATFMSKISYVLPNREEVTIEIFDFTGRKIKTLVKRVETAGSHIVHWQLKDDRGKKVPSGVYFCRLKAGKYIATRKILIAR